MSNQKNETTEALRELIALSETKGGSPEEAKEREQRSKRALDRFQVAVALVLVRDLNH